MLNKILCSMGCHGNHITFINNKYTYYEGNVLHFGDSYRCELCGEYVIVNYECDTKRGIGVKNRHLSTANSYYDRNNA